MPGLFIYGFLFLIAFQLTILHKPLAWKDHFGNKPEGTFLGIVSEPPSTRSNYIKTVLKVIQRRDAGKWDPVRGKALTYFYTKRNNDLIQYGDVILFHTGFKKIADQSNPHSFRYATYLNMKGISHQSYVFASNWKKIPIPSPDFFKRFAFQLRDRLLNILRSNDITGKEFAVASALLLGYVEDLDDELRKDYAATGAMHILSVSGMHVGIIYVFLEFLLAFLSRHKTGRILKTIILLVFIWFYAFLTGLSPCVMRAAAMLSLPIIAKLLGRPSDILNILSASIIFILMIDPFLVLDVGFQLSYLAVIGIVWLYKPIYDLFTFTSRIPDKIWSILAVSIAAQLSTLPITLYTFHQFPNYFMLTNIFVIPLSSLIIYDGILVLATGSIPFICHVLARILDFLIWFLNTVIHFIEQLPFSTIRGIYPGILEMMLLYFLLVTGFLLLTTRRSTWLFIFMITLLMVNISILHTKIQRLNSTRFIVYNSRNSSLFQFSSRDHAVVFYDIYTFADENYFVKLRQTVQGDHDAHGIRIKRFNWLESKIPKAGIPNTFTVLSKSGHFFKFCGKRIGILNKKIPKGFTASMPLDYLIISGNPVVNLRDVQKIFRPGMVILDGRNSGFRINQWLDTAKTMKIPCHSVNKNGAFEIEF